MNLICISIIKISSAMTLPKGYTIKLDTFTTDSPEPLLTTVFTMAKNIKNIIIAVDVEIQLSKEKGWHSINQFNPATLLYLSRPKGPSAYMSWSFVCVLWFEVRGG